jgi:2-dehydropantoate 2-reductase
MEIVVFGAGSLGSLVGGVLAREHTVTLVGRDPHVSAVQDSGLTIEGEFAETVTPAATTDGTDHVADLALVTVKAFDTAAAAEQLATGRFEVVCSLQNGIGNEETLAERLDTPVVAGTITYGARLAEAGRVECTGTGEVVLGSPDGGSSTHATRVSQAFREVGFQATAVSDMPRRLWKKLAINAGINATTALARIENGALVDGPAGQPAREAARETARVAQCAGVDLSESTAAEAVDTVARGTAANTSSMLQDVLAGCRTEVDAINGAVANRAAESDVDAPVNTVLATLLRAWEHDRTG